MTTSFRAALVSALLLGGACATTNITHPPEADATFDVVIRHARIVDGTGNPWYQGDVGIRGDRIAAVGNIAASATARRTIDGTGLVVAPGFIDMLGHSERTLLTRPTAVSKITQGITSEITGEVDSAWPNGTPSSPSTDPWHSLGGCASPSSSAEGRRSISVPTWPLVRCAER